MPFWGYIIIIAALLLFYVLFTFIIYRLMKKAQKKCYLELEKVLPIEKDRFEYILSVKKELINDNQTLPKNLLDLTKANEDLFNQIPVDLAKVKGQDDFLTIYYLKYIQEKMLKGKEERIKKYQDISLKLKESLHSDPNDKNSPYLAYNKSANHYNAYLNMMVLAILNVRAKNESAPTL